MAIESGHTIDIDSFMSKSEIDERYVDSPYYLVPENKIALEAFAVIRDAILGKAMVALGRVVLSKRERIIMLQPRGKNLLGATLRFPYEVRDEAIYFRDIAVPEDMLALAEHMLESKAAAFDPTLFHDRYEKAVVAMLNDKRAGMPIFKERPIPRISRHGLDGGVARKHGGRGQTNGRLWPRKASESRRETPTNARFCCLSPAADPQKKRQRNRSKSRLAEKGR